MADTSTHNAIALLEGKRITVVTGAGISTDSGIPDYRGTGSPQRVPMQFDRFLESRRARQRYWLGSQVGYRTFAAVHPNAGHAALATLEASGNIARLVTQNVDDLHEQAGSNRVTHLHGTVHYIVCLQCHSRFPRAAISALIDRANPWLEAVATVAMNPDGDTEVADVERFVVPDCPVCGGMLKPDVVFFGETVPLAVFREASDAVIASQAVLVAGSSLAVNSAVRLLQQAARQHLPIVVINRGPTKWDARADIRIEGGTSEVLATLADRLAPLSR